MWNRFQCQTIIKKKNIKLWRRFLLGIDKIFVGRKCFNLVEIFRIFKIYIICENKDYPSEAREMSLSRAWFFNGNFTSRFSSRFYYLAALYETTERRKVFSLCERKQRTNEMTAHATLDIEFILLRASTHFVSLSYGRLVYASLVDNDESVRWRLHY